MVIMQYDPRPYIPVLYTFYSTLPTKSCLYL